MVFVTVSAHPARPAPLDGRYETLRTLGQGGAGAVYLARDRDTGEVIAMKKLLRMDPKNILRLKREFRSLADIHHRNLVQLYDLGYSDDGWFIAMEYIDGPDLLTYLAAEARAKLDHDVKSTRQLTAHHAKLTVAELSHVISAFQQLAKAISALHRAGMLHRDLKPSNVLVAGGRVVVLDFGLVRGLDSEDLLITQEGVISGTPAYMAPEQASGQSLDEAADWYAFGVMLFEALSGQLPVEGRTAIELVVRKSTVEPTPLARVAPEVPHELAGLCDGLLRRDPAARTTGEIVSRTLERLLGDFSFRAPSLELIDVSPITQTMPLGATQAASLVGRSRELEQLAEGLSAACETGAIVMHVRGTSGAGKSSLVQEFVERLDEDAVRCGGRGALVLRSRCNEREAMPYKALDGVMDSLVQHLRELNDFDLGRLVPVDVVELAQLFPGLHGVPGLRRSLGTMRPTADALASRVRAEAALRELFARLAARRPLVVWIDDLHWGDLDSASILKVLPEQLASSHVLFVFSYRTAEVDTSPCLRMLLERPILRDSGRIIRERAIQVEPLTAGDVRSLCQRLLETAATERPELVEAIVREAQGNPFLVLQLAALVQDKLARGDADLGSLSIEQLVDQATDQLPPEAKSMLAVLAVGGRPIEPKIVLLVAGVRHEGRALLHALRRLRLLRSRDVGGRQLLEVYHDRVRESVYAALDAAERQRVHAALLEALESDSDSDPGWLHTLALGAGQRAAALRYGLSAAGRAEAMLAFERAAELYQSCIELTDAGADTSRLRLHLADALARSGHGARAAEAYLAVAKSLPPAAGAHYMRLASAHFMRTGDWERGDAILKEVFARLGITVPETDAGVLAAIVWERTALKLRGLDFEWTKTQPPPEVQQTIELYTTLSIEYQAFDPVRAALFQARGLRAALAAREPWFVARSLCAAAVSACVAGSDRAGGEADVLLKRAEGLARDTGIHALQADILAARAVCSFFLARTNDIVEPSIEAERQYRARPTTDALGDYFHRFVAVAVRVGALHYLGRNQLAQVELARALGEARATNNRNAVLQLTLCQTYADGLTNTYESSRRRLEEERQFLPPGRFGPLHALHMIAVLRTACGLHDYTWVADWIEEDWARWQGSFVRHSAFLSFLAVGAHARYLFNRHIEERRTEDLSALLKDDMRVIRGLPFDEARVGLRARLEARIAYVRGDLATAVEGMRKNAAFLEQAGAVAELSREQYTMGFMQGEAGATLRAASDRRMRELGYADPLAEVLAHYPELVPPRS